MSQEFLVHMSFNHCDDSVMKIMAKKPYMFGLNLQSEDLPTSQSKICQGFHVASLREDPLGHYDVVNQDRSP